MNKNYKQVSVSIKILASKTNVFNAVTNWQDQKKWIFLTKVRGVGADSHRLGGKLEAFTGLGKIGFLDTMTITAWDAPNVCEVTHTGNIVKGKGIFEVTTKNQSTYFTWTEYIELPLGAFGRLGWIFVKPITVLGLWFSLKRLKMFIETTN